MTWIARSALPVAVLTLFVAVLGASGRAPAADGPHMLAQAMRLAGWLRAGDVGPALSELFHLAQPHPPVGYLPLVVFAVVGLPLRGIVAASAATWLLVLLDGTMRLCRPAPWWSGQVAWALASGTAMVWWSADHAGFDLPAAATVVQALGWLHASDGLAKRREAAIFGLWLAAAFLTKYSTPLILVLPVVVGCLPAVWRQPRNLALAVAVWAVTAGLYLLVNREGIVAYVDSALNPPATPGNFPERMTTLERFGGEGQRMFVAVLKESVGWPGLVALGVGAAIARRPLPILGLVSGIVLLGAMNSREARYALPMVYLLAAAGAPAAGAAWQHAAILLGLTLPNLRASATVFATCGPECAPPQRTTLKVDSAVLGAWGAWPNPPAAFLPLSEQPVAWKVPEVVDALAAAGAQGGAYVVLGGSASAPGVSTYQLEIARRGLRLDLLSVVARLGAQGLEASVFGQPGGPMSARPRFAYVVETPASVTGSPVGEFGDWSAGSASAAWLAANPHRELRTWALPGGAVGHLVELM